MITQEIKDVLNSQSSPDITISQWAKKLHVPQYVIRKYLNRHKLPYKQTGYNENSRKDLSQKIKHLNEDKKLPFLVISKMLKISLDKVYRVGKELGLTNHKQSPEALQSLLKSMEVEPVPANSLTV